MYIKPFSLPQSSRPKVYNPNIQKSGFQHSTILSYSSSNNESAGKKKSVRITRAGVYLKPALVQVAYAAVKSKDSPYYANKYERIYKRRGKKRAIIAIARMILTAVFYMLQNGEVWNPRDLFKVDIPYALQEKQKQKAIQNAIQNALKLLVREGVISPLDSPAA